MPPSDRLAVSGRQPGHEKVVAAIKHSLAEGRYDGRMLPSYRQLIRELDVTMANVERAMAQLEREGLVRRESGRGVFPRVRCRSVAAKKQLPLKCISFLQRSHTFLPSFVESDYLAGYTDALDYSDIRTRFVLGDELEPSHARLFSPILPIEAQGVVLINSCPPEHDACSLELFEWLQRHSVPFVVQYYAQYATEGLPPHVSIYVNKAGGASQAVDYLFKLGHRDIGFVGLVKPDFPHLNKVFEGYRATLTCAGLNCQAKNIAHCETLEGRERFAIVKDFLDRPQRPTAILTSCDQIARSLLDAARALSIRVPEELSIIGYDNEPGSDQTNPPLTTVSVPRRELAKSAVELLLEAAAAPRVPPRTKILETHLIIRETTAPVGAIHKK